MKICGIIAEYDPFHHGHAWQLERAKAESGADYIICVMSCQFTQRGMPAYLCAHDRAEMALRSGADIVLGLPYAFSVCDAEHFALGGIEILRKTGVVNALSFGVEPQGLSYINMAATMLENPSESYIQYLKNSLSEGLPYPKAQGNALARVFHAEESIFSLPNASLAICYARAIMRLKADFNLYPITRRGAYHSTELSGTGSYALPSASAVRAALIEGNLQAVRASIPDTSYAILERSLNSGCFHPPGALDLLLRYKLRQTSDFTYLPDLSEGIENRFAWAAQMLTRDEMVKQIKTKRYPYARINRLLSHVLTDTRVSKLDDLPSYAYLLGFRQRAKDILHQINKHELQLLHRLPAKQEMTYMHELDAGADDLWSLGAHQPLGQLYRAKPVIVP